jgi:hypothetical protein
MLKSLSFLKKVFSAPVVSTPMTFLIIGEEEETIIKERSALLEVIQHLLMKNNGITSKTELSKSLLF